MNKIEDMLELAVAARLNAHAPYSGFKVGACIRTDDDRLFAGCNVENVAYPQGQCAEAGAIGAMVAAGGRRIVEVVVVAEGENLCTLAAAAASVLRSFPAPTRQSTLPAPMAHAPASPWQSSCPMPSISSQIRHERRI